MFAAAAPLLLRFNPGSKGPKPLLARYEPVARCFVARV